MPSKLISKAKPKTDNLLLLDHLDVQVRYREDLSKYTTFRLGGACKGLIFCHTPCQLISVVELLRHEKQEFILIGGGSNLVVSDQGLDCYVIRFVSDIPLIERHGHELKVAASTSLDSLAYYAATEGLEGINYTSGIPGSVGGAVVGNAGAFGKQIGDVARSVEVLTKNGMVKNLIAGDCGFSYRDSHLKTTGDIVLSVRLKLQPGSREDLLKEREEILNIRKGKHPNLETDPCAGSFFRNVEPTSKAGKRQAAGWFLEQAGGKDLKVGGVHIYPKHANIIVKGVAGCAQDVFELQKHMQELAKKKFGLDLVREVRFVGKFDGMPRNVKEYIW